MEGSGQCESGRVQLRPATAGIIIIGNEILKGRVQDTNSHYLCQQLWTCGVKVCKVVVVADNREEIAEEVRRFSVAYDYILTTGGIGPTHDDVTIEAVGVAFGEECVPHPKILQFFSGCDGGGGGGESDEDDDDKEERRDEAVEKMALVPRSAEVHWEPSSSFLLVCIHNVHCYPGIPSMLRDIFQANKSLYRKGPTVEFHSRDLLISCHEEILVKPLLLVQSEYPAVQLGSYPNTSLTESHRVKITLESEDIRALDKAYTRLALLLPKNVMMSSQENHSSQQPLEKKKKIGWLLDRLSPGLASLFPPSLCSKISHTLSTIHEAYQKYSFHEVCVAFNGGKDCTAMLDLLHSYLVHKGHDFSKQKIQVLYVVRSTQFPEVEQFVQTAVSHYSLELIKISGLGIKDALSQLKTSHPHFKAIMMGTRHTDPFSAGLSDFSPTDSSWPEYVRVNCLLDWSYMEVWMFLRIMSIPYCPLYDRGYSSLDGMEDTHKNSHLAVSTDTQLLTGQPDTAGGYLPAYMLANEEHERAGRSRN